MTRKLIYLLIMLFAIGAEAQTYSTTNKKAIAQYEKALKALNSGDKETALNSLQQALQTDDTFLEAHLVLADLWQDAARFEEEASGDKQAQLARQYRGNAKTHYRAVVERREDYFPPAWVNLGNAELTDGNYDEAIHCLTKYLSLKTSDKENNLDAARGIEIAKFRKEALAHPLPFNPTNLGDGVNSKYDEYLPSLTADGQTLVFTRRFPRKPTTTANTREEEDLYTSKLEGAQWGKASRLPEPLNSGDNEGAQCISQDGRIMFFTACERQDGGGRCDVYMCINKNGTWGKPRNLGPDVNSGAWEGQPSFSIDGKTLYFVSNRKGGYGGMDIWKTTFENGRWTEPQNLGPEINSQWNEMSPFIHFDDQTLYFASDRPVGMGGYDIYLARKSGDSWQEPTNIGYPINGENDDNNMIVSADGRTAFYASNRKGGYGKMDIYSFELPVKARPNAAVCFKGTISNAQTGERVAADIKVVRLSDGTTVANTSSDKSEGRYIISLPEGEEYAFMVSAKGYLFHSQNQPATHVDNSWQPVTVDIALQPIVAGNTIALRNVFFETGRHEIMPTSGYELGKVVELLKQNPTLRIELGGHTDNVGNDQSNLQLSERRAKAVLDWLVAHGIEPSRLSHKGYGETKPVASNENEEGRALNRRVEMKVL